MKKVVVFTVVACLLATSMAFAGTKKKKKKAKTQGYSVVEVMKKAKKGKKAKTTSSLFDVEIGQ